MTASEAIKHLEFSKKSYQNLIDNDTRNGEVIGKDTTGTWKANTSLATVYQTMHDTMVVAIRSLEAWEEIQRTIRMIQNCDKVIDMSGAVLDIVWRYLREVEHDE